MNKFYFFIFFLGFSMLGFGQVIPPDASTEEQIEILTQNNEDAESEDDSYLQELQIFLRHPLNINSATKEQWQVFNLISPMQIEQFYKYKSMMGNFISIYEMQAIPGWTVDLLQKIKPFITCEQEFKLGEAFSERISNGEHSIVLRASKVLEKSKGYLIDPNSGRNYYKGSPERIFFRYKYQYKNLLQFGIVGEKDPGEHFFKGAQKHGFDFYSAHIFARNLGIVKAVALGDYSVNMGQGLTQWMSMAFKKSTEATSVKRQAAVLRPYNSAGEFFFHRGVGITIGKKNWEATVFGSFKRTDANFITDTSSNFEDYVSSFLTSGLHRTQSEIDDKNKQRQLAFGGNFKYDFRGWNLGLNAVQFSFKLPINKRPDPYNLYALSGKKLGNYSIDWSKTYKNLHWFGEAAISNTKSKAVVSGLMMSLAAQLDFSLLYRNIEKSYQTLYAGAFTESTNPNNEKGLYAGITIRPTGFLRIDGYADFFKFPWLKYRVDAPSSGREFLVRVLYKPNKKLELYTTFRNEQKPINISGDTSVMTGLYTPIKQNWRTQFLYKLNDKFSVRSRVELIRFHSKEIINESGFMFFTDFIYKPMMAKLNASVRFQFFDTDSYNTRVYAYENDVLYTYSIPVLYDKGMRIYANANYDFTKKLTFWLKIGRTIYKERTSIGSALDEIQGNSKTELRMQLRYLF